MPPLPPPPVNVHVAGSHLNVVHDLGLEEGLGGIVHDFVAQLGLGNVLAQLLDAGALGWGTVLVDNLKNIIN